MLFRSPHLQEERGLDGWGPQGVRGRRPHRAFFAGAAPWGLRVRPRSGARLALFWLCGAPQLPTANANAPQNPAPRPQPRALPQFSSIEEAVREDPTGRGAVLFLLANRTADGFAVFDTLGGAKADSASFQLTSDFCIDPMGVYNGWSARQVPFRRHWAPPGASNLASESPRRTQQGTCVGRRRYLGAAFFGCVPVLVKPDTLALPFEDHPEAREGRSWVAPTRPAPARQRCCRPKGFS